MKKVLFHTISFTWGIPQNLFGGMLALLLFRRPSYRYGRCHVTKWKLQSSLSLGSFLFLGGTQDKRMEEYLLFHEIGHTLQSLILGPLYLPVIGIPSLLWAGCFGPYRRKHQVSYDAFYTESWANCLSRRYRKIISPIKVSLQRSVDLSP